MMPDSTDDFSADRFVTASLRVVVAMLKQGHTLDESCRLASDAVRQYFEPDEMPYEALSFFQTVRKFTRTNAEMAVLLTQLADKWKSEKAV